MLPISLITVETKPTKVSDFDKSKGRTRCFVGCMSLAFNSFRPLTFRADKTKRAPACSNCRANSAPIPEEAPVIHMTLLS